MSCLRKVGWLAVQNSHSVAAIKAFLKYLFCGIAKKGVFVFKPLKTYYILEGFMFKSSLKELKSIKTVVLCGLLIAVAAAIEALNPLNFGELLKIRLDFAATAVMGFVAGPVASLIAAAVGDVVRYIIKPAGGAFFPGYTLSAAVGGFIYGIFLYKKNKQIFKNKIADIGVKCFLAKLCINVFVNLVLNSLWISMTTGKALAVLMPMRIIKNAVALPFEAVILTAVIYFVDRYLKKYV